MKLSQLGVVARGDFSPTTDPVLRHLEEEGIETIDQYGYSYGEVATADIMQRAAQETRTAVVYDTARAVEWIKKWKLPGGLRLVNSFNASGRPMQSYVEESEFPLFVDARDNSPGLIAYSAGVLRASNIAVGLGIAEGGYVDHTSAALTAQPDARYVAGWGTQSEFNINGATETAVSDLSAAFGSRIVARPVNGHHAAANNPYLQAALVKEGLST